MNVLSLCSGIGAMDLGLQRAGMRIVGQVEIDDYCRQVLAKHWKDVPRHDDVRTAVEWWRVGSRPAVDVVAGGFPCQPASTAGLRLGTDDPRWLWPAFFAVVVALRPAWVLWENVPGLRTRGLDVVHADLVRAGYRHRIGRASACAVGAPHTRERLLGPRRGDGAGSALLEPGRRGPQPGRPWADRPRPHGVAHGVARGVDRRRALGNAVVPAVAEHVGRLIVGAHSHCREAS